MKPTILIVDDDHFLREALSDYFQERGFFVLDASNGLEALDILSKNQVTVVLSDIQMPKMNGVDFLKAVCHVNEFHSSVYLMSGWSQFKTDELIQLGAAGFFNKPIDFKLLSEFSSKFLKLAQAR